MFIDITESKFCTKNFKNNLRFQNGIQNLEKSIHSLFFNLFGHKVHEFKCLLSSKSQNLQLKNS